MMAGITGGARVGRITSKCFGTLRWSQRCALADNGDMDHARNTFVADRHPDPDHHFAVAVWRSSLAFRHGIDADQCETKLKLRWRRASATFLFTMFVIAGFVLGGMYLVTH
jgi:hypothetical protein